ncbi:GNAT family N-acetyltransferase [Cellulomonas sp. NPDC089187]|uniref:GNAT family N-acetyltransferase n=1 Tax=Cellulomonas sp. NPDC089187 TaxID=3154970 RepID=UPI003431F98C
MPGHYAEERFEEVAAAVRSSAVVRSIRPEDADQVVDLCLAARKESMLGSQLCTDDPERLRHQVGAMTAEPGALALVGELDGRVHGLILARVVGPSLFTDEVSVGIEAVYVGESARRRGIGHALLAGVAEQAEQVGAVEIFAVPLPGARGVLRFLSRLGFAPAAAHRVVSVETLQRRLSTESGPQRSRGIDDLVARRRAARATRSEGQLSGLASISMQVSRAVHTRRPRGSSTTTS